MLSILRKARLKDKEMRILMLYVADPLISKFKCNLEAAALTMPERQR